MPYDPYYRTERRRRRSRWLRWFLLFGLVMLLPIPIIDTLTPGQHHGALPPPGMYLPLVFAIIYSPFARAPWFTARGRAKFDEFELAALHRATTAAYATFLAIVLAAFVWLWLATLMAWPMPATPPAWAAWGYGLLLLGLALPATYAEWMVPLPPVEPNEDDGELL